MRITLTSVLLFLFFWGAAQTIIVDTSFVTTVLECESDFVTFPDGVRYFSGLVVKQGNRFYYLNAPYRVEMLDTTRLVFEDDDSYNDLVTVYRARTYYPDIEEFKQAAVACLAAASSYEIDSISYYGDTLYVYAGGNPVPFTTYIDSCPCEEESPPLCVYVMGDPATGEVVGDPGTGQVLFVQECPGGMAFAPTSKKIIKKTAPCPPKPEIGVAAAKDP